MLCELYSVLYIEVQPQPASNIFAQIVEILRRPVSPSQHKNMIPT